MDSKLKATGGPEKESHLAAGGEARPAAAAARCYDPESDLRENLKTLRPVCEWRKKEEGEEEAIQSSCQIKFTLSMCK